MTREYGGYFQALTRFRCGMYAMLGDIRKMFWQIKLSTNDVQYHGVIWDGETYVHTRVTFGGNSSPPIADRSMMKIAAAGKEAYPNGSEVIENKRFVDDLMDASQNKGKIVLKRDETQALLGKFGFEIKIWRSNHPDVGAVERDIKVLGARWNAVTDELAPTFSDGYVAEILTKRTMLSKKAEI